MSTNRNATPDVGATAHSKRRSTPLVLMLLALNALLAATAATQWLAYRFGYHANLGKPMLPASRTVFLGFVCGAVVLGVAAGLLALFPTSRRFAPAVGVLAVACAGLSWGPVYAPHQFIRWMIAASGTPRYAWLPDQALLGFGAGFCAGLVGTLPLLRSRRRSPSASHGSARWGSGEKLMGRENDENQPGRDDFLIGRKDDELLHYGGDGHLMTVAPTRSGKGTGAVIPNLLSYRGSVVVNDPKGENWHVTRAYRERKLRHECVALDPFGIATGSEGAFNPLGVLDPSRPNANDDAIMIADMLVTGSETGMKQFWNNEARALLSGLILYVTTAHERGNPKRSLTEMRRLLTLPPGKGSGDENKEEHPDTGVHGDPDTFGELLRDMQHAGGLVERAANRIMQKSDRERSSVISSAQSNTHFLDSPYMEDVLEHTTFKMSDLRDGDLSLYLVLPPSEMNAYRPWLRVVVTSMMRSLTRSQNTERQRVLFLLDEFAKLGHMDPVADAVSLMAGYEVTLWLFLQDLSQLKDNYNDEWQTFMANVDVLQAFGTKDQFTADYVSKAAGEQTIFQKSTKRNKGKSGGSHRRGEGSSVSETGRRLVTPDEIRRMPTSKQLLFVENQDPLFTDKLSYLNDAEFTDESGKPLYDENPLHGPNGTGSE